MRSSLSHSPATKLNKAHTNRTQRLVLGAPPNPVPPHNTLRTRYRLGDTRKRGPPSRTMLIWLRGSARVGSPVACET
jgi:hypothetical protein